MYTLIRDPDGTVTLRTHVDVAALPAAEARRLLRALAPVLSILRERSRSDQPAPAAWRPGEAPAAARVPAHAAVRQSVARHLELSPVA